EGAVLRPLAIRGNRGWESLQQDERCLIPFAAIECVPPPGLERTDFLNDVQYLAGLPERLSLLDEEIMSRLQVAFGRHPWVSGVEEVKLTPPRRVQVRLRFRRPVLAVRWSGQLRVVDGDGVLLPAAAK